MELIGEEGFFINHGEPRQHLHPRHHHHQGFPGGSVVKNLPANAGGVKLPFNFLLAQVSHS